MRVRVASVTKAAYPSVMLETSETLRRLHEWVREALTDPHVGVPPDAFDVRPSPHRFPYFDGPNPPGESEPDGGIRYRPFEIRIAFPEHAERREIEAVVARLERLLGDDPTLGGRFRPGSVRLRGEDKRVESEGGWYGERSPLVTVPVMVSEIE